MPEVLPVKTLHIIKASASVKSDLLVKDILHSAGLVKLLRRLESDNEELQLGLHRERRIVFLEAA